MSAREWVTYPGDDAPTYLHVRNDNCGARGCLPRVVIDPEDREQIAALMRLYYRDINGQSVEVGDELVDTMQAALREFANPVVKPDEPTGLGAVVEDEAGNQWVAISVPSISTGAWVLVGTVGPARLWRSINAVRVLSEGVTT